MLHCSIILSSACIAGWCVGEVAWRSVSMVSCIRTNVRWLSGVEVVEWGSRFDLSYAPIFLAGISAACSMI